MPRRNVFGLRRICILHELRLRHLPGGLRCVELRQLLLRHFPIKCGCVELCGVFTGNVLRLRRRIGSVKLRELRCGPGGVC